LLLLVSATTAGFVWTFDLVVLLPALIQCSVWLSDRPTAPRRNFLLFSYFLINFILLAGKIYLRNDLWYFWAAPGFLVLYLGLRANLQK